MAVNFYPIKGVPVQARLPWSLRNRDFHFPGVLGEIILSSRVAGSGIPRKSMTHTLILTFVILCAISLRGQTPQPDPQLAGLVQSISSQVNGREALDFVAQIYDRDRWANFAKFQQSAAWVRHAMHDIGLHNIEASSSPADGVTQFGFWTMPMAWDVEKGEA